MLLTFAIYSTGFVLPFIVYHPAAFDIVDVHFSAVSAMEISTIRTSAIEGTNVRKCDNKLDWQMKMIIAHALHIKTLAWRLMLFSLANGLLYTQHPALA